MNPTATLRMRRTTAFLAGIWALLAIILSIGSLGTPAEGRYHPFGVSPIGPKLVVERVSPPAADSGITPGDAVLSVNGEPFGIVLRRGNDWMRAGDANRYVFENVDGQRFEVLLDPAPVEFSTTHRSVLFHVLMLLVACIYLATGATVWWLKPGHSAAWALLLFCSTMAVQLACMIHTDMIPSAFLRMDVNLPLIAATTFHLFTTYPIEPGWVVRHRRIQIVPYAVAAVLIAISLSEGVLGIPAGVGSTLSLIFVLTVIVGSVAIVGWERRHIQDGSIRDRADVMFLGAAVSFLPVTAVLVAQFIAQRPMPYYLALLWVFLFPVAVGYGVVRRQLFEVRVMAKSSAAYGAASLAITGGFAILITFADTLTSRFGVSGRWSQATLLFIAILLFNPVRNRMQSLVDRFFDRDRAAYRVVLREISEAMVSMLSLNEIADRILMALTDTMGVERASVLLVDDERKLLLPMASRGDWDGEMERIVITSDHPIWKSLWMRREDLLRVDFDDDPDPESREACRDVFDTLEVELLVPILYGVDLLGVIAVGRKLSRDRLSGDDRLLLRTLANQSSIAIENAKAFDEIAKLNETLEQRVEERTAELRATQAQLTQAEKMKSLGQLVAGVAHELNNPIGFVHANLQLLEEFVKKLTDGQRSEADTERTQEAIAKLLMRSREGTQRVKKIVQDLRAFSRTDQAELQDADLHEELELTLALMEPRFKNGVTVERDFGDLPRVRCYPGQLNQVFMNLLINACDAMQDDGTIRIETRRTPDGVSLSFHDTGPGIPDEVLSRIFDPFFTTKPVGVGTGLGLSLSHGIIERHGGRFIVDSKPGSGTTFTIELPLDATPLDATPPVDPRPVAPSPRTMR